MQRGKERRQQELWKEQELECSDVEVHVILLLHCCYTLVTHSHTVVTSQSDEDGEYHPVQKKGTSWDATATYAVVLLCVLFVYSCL
jgi:hypothetical protein